MGDSMQTFTIAVIGAGPAGYFAAQALQSSQDDTIQIHVDIIERLPTPWGLVRSGVAPDHPKIKQVSKVFEKVAAQPNIRLLANVNVGVDIALDEVKEHYDAVVIAVGTPNGRSLGIPGELLPNVISSAEFVSWYNGHPDYKDLSVDLSGTRAIVIGAGNVAMDVGRMLAKDPLELAFTDIADHALSVLHQSKIRDVTIVARRGAEHAAFTSPELRDISNLKSTRVNINRDDVTRGFERSGLGTDKRRNSNLESMLAISESPTRDALRSLSFIFEHKPVEIKGRNRIESVIFDSPLGRCEIPCDLLVTAIGYEPNGLLGLEIDGNRYANKGGQITENLFVVGWAKRGPSGVIGTNKSDSTDVMNQLVKGLGVPKARRDLVPLLQDRGVKVIDQVGWSKINETELNLGVDEGRPRVKIADRATMIEIASVEQ